MGRHTSWGALAVSLFVAACATQAQQPPPITPDSGPVIQVAVERVDVGVIVTDASGHFAEGLQKKDFTILSDGVPQPITDFSATQDPARVLLLVEAGPAVYLLEGGHLQAAYTLLEGLSPGDSVAVAGYDSAPHGVLDFTTDKQLAARALDGLNFNLGFSQLNLSVSLAKALDWLAPIRGKKTIVLLSSGVDTSPETAQTKLRERLRSSEVRLLAVSLAAELRTPDPRSKKSGKNGRRAAEASPLTESFDAADEQLRRLAAATGGRAYYPRNEAEFKEAYAEIAQLVRHEYSLAFAPEDRDGKMHELRVLVSAPEGWPAAEQFAVSHRQAYVAPGPEKSPQ